MPRIEPVARPVTQRAGKVELLERVSVEHDQVVELLEQEGAVGRDQQVQAFADQPRQHPREGHLVLGVEVALRIVYDQELPADRGVPGEEVEVGHSPGRGRSQAKRDIELPAALLRYEPNRIPA